MFKDYNMLYVFIIKIYLVQQFTLTRKINCEKCSKNLKNTNKYEKENVKYKYYKNYKYLENLKYSFHLLSCVLQHQRKNLMTWQQNLSSKND